MYVTPSTVTVADPLAQLPANTPLLYWALRSTTSALVPLTNTCLSVLGDPLASVSTLLMFITKACLPSVLKSKISIPWMRAATSGSVISSVLVGGVFVEVMVVFRLSASDRFRSARDMLVSCGWLRSLVITVDKVSVVSKLAFVIRLLTSVGRCVLAA